MIACRVLGIAPPDLRELRGDAARSALDAWKRGVVRPAFIAAARNADPAMLVDLIAARDYLLAVEIEPPSRRSRWARIQTPTLAATL